MGRVLRRLRLPVVAVVVVLATVGHDLLMAADAHAVGDHLATVHGSATHAIGHAVGVAAAVATADGCAIGQAAARRGDDPGPDLVVGGSDDRPLRWPRSTRAHTSPDALAPPSRVRRALLQVYRI